MKRAEREQYKSWLASLKPGDEVGVQPMIGNAPGGEPEIGAVKSVWNDSIAVKYPSHCIVRWFKWSNGRAKDSAFGAKMLVPVTDEMRKRQRLEDAVWKLGGMSRRHWREVGADKITRIIAILDENAGPKSHRPAGHDGDGTDET